MGLRSCILPEGKFVYTVHSPSYVVANLRENDYIHALGVFPGGEAHDNRVNFPAGEVDVPRGGTVFEVPNLFPFRGATFINKVWADENAVVPARIRLPDPPEISLQKEIDALANETGASGGVADCFWRRLPEPLALALGQTSTDARDLVRLAESACEFVHDPDTGAPVGMRFFRDEKGRVRARISRRDLFEVVANNPYLPEAYRQIMVLRPGAQGDSEIVGEWRSMDEKSHVFEYLRSNSYIPWGHYAANMADDAVRYRIEDLTEDDMTGMRHLYYQRTFVRIAEDLGMPGISRRKAIAPADLERLRLEICGELADTRRRGSLSFNRTLWGWNFGFDFSPTGYRLHGSHQQVHQQYAMIPHSVDPAGAADPSVYPYACGDRIETFVDAYREQTGACFFDALVRAVQSNERMDGAADRPSDLVVFSDENVLLFVPKAQTSQWELNLVPLSPVGNIVEADQNVRRSLDFAILTAVRALSGLGARMITSIECSKRLDSPDTGQRLLYCFLPRLPESPGSFSEAQHRWISGHYPEDFAAACRRQVGR
ncbi:MAG: hypothetical protein R6T92_13825 [Desulfosalsimonadaceae bacterium]